MEEENKFEEELKAGVKEDSTQRMQALMEERENIVRSLEEKKAIDYDPKETTAMQKRLAEIEKEIEAGDITSIEKPVEIDNPEENKNKDEKQEDEEKKEKKQQDIDDSDEDITKPPKDIEEKEQSEDKNVNDKDKLKNEYHKALIELYQKKQETLTKQKDKHMLVSPEEDYRAEIKLEGELYTVRDKYMQLGKEDPYSAERTKLIEKEKKAKEPIEAELRERARKFRELEDEIRKIDKEEKEINEKLQNPEIEENEIKALKNRLNELGIKRERVESELAEIKDGLNEAIEVRQRRAMQRNGLEHEYVSSLTSEDMKNYNYQESKTAVMNDNAEKANNQEYDNIAKRIAEREQRIEKINKELNEVDETDFERRLELLDTLDRETSMLNADRESKSDLDRKVPESKEEKKQDAEEKKEGEYERQEDFAQDTDDARAIIDKMKEKGVPEETQSEETQSKVEESRDDLEAVVVAGAVANGPVEGAMAYGAVKAIQKLEDRENEEKDPFRSQLSSQTLSEEEITKKDAEELKQQKVADKELDDIQQNLQDQQR